MPRYYYTDALKAAWMAREFKTHFCNPINMELIGSLHFIINKGKCFVHLLGHPERKKDKHDSMLVIFKPQDNS